MSSPNTHPHRLERHRSSLGFLSTRYIPALHGAPKEPKQRRSSCEPRWGAPSATAFTKKAKAVAKSVRISARIDDSSQAPKKAPQTRRDATVDPNDIDPKGWDRLVISQDNHWKSAFDVFVAICVLFTAVSVPIELAYRVRAPRFALTPASISWLAHRKDLIRPSCGHTPLTSPARLIARVRTTSRPQSTGCSTSSSSWTSSFNSSTASRTRAFPSPSCDASRGATCARGLLSTSSSRFRSSGSWRELRGRSRSSSSRRCPTPRTYLSTPPRRPAPCTPPTARCCPDCSPQPPSLLRRRSGFVHLPTRAVPHARCTRLLMRVAPATGHPRTRSPLSPALPLSRRFDFCECAD